MTYLDTIRDYLDRHDCELESLSDKKIADRFNGKTIARNRPALLGVEMISIGYELGLHRLKSEVVTETQIAMARSL